MVNALNSLNNQYNITLIGCGKMGGAMLRSWLSNDLVRHVNVVDPHPLTDEFSDEARISYSPSFSVELINCDIVILAVKPQILESALQGIKNHNNARNTAFLSIAAGQTLNTLESFLGADQAIIRTMPNTPAAIDKGMSVSVANSYVSAQKKQVADNLLNSTGMSLWVEDETLMDAVTALSGSGPAYVFYLIEVMASAGERLGLDKEMSMSLARQTVIGSAALAEAEETLSASTLRKNVTSPGGTTQAALEKLMDGDFQSIFDSALLRAQKRAEELNG